MEACSFQSQLLFVDIEAHILVKRPFKSNFGFVTVPPRTWTENSWVISGASLTCLAQLVSVLCLRLTQRTTTPAHTTTATPRRHATTVSLQRSPHASLSVESGNTLALVTHNSGCDLGELRRKCQFQIHHSASNNVRRATLTLQAGFRKSASLLSVGRRRRVRFTRAVQEDTELADVDTVGS